MAIYFVDTSALAKRYVNKPGTRWVRSWTRYEAQNSILIAELTSLEIFALLARREILGDISPSSANRRRQAFLYHASQDYDVIQVNSSIFIESRDLVTKHASLWLRSLDAIQLACALTARRAIGQPLIFVSADERLLQAAADEGFAIDDPNRHH